MTLSKQFRSPLTALWGMKVLGVLINFYVTRLLTRDLPLEEYAKYSLLIAIALVFTSAVELGSGAILVRYYPIFGERVVKQTITLVVIWGTILTISVLIIVLLSHAEVFIDTLIVMSILVTNAILTTTATIELARQKVTKYSLIIFGEKLLLAIILFYLSSNQWLTVRYILIAYSVSNIAVSLKYVLKSFSLRTILSARDTLVNIYSYGLPLGVSTLLAFAFGMGDRYIVDYFLGREIVAIYSFSFFVTNAAFQFIISALNSIGEPSFWKLHESESNASAFRFRQQLENSYVVAGVCLLLGLVYGKEIIVKVLSRDEYLVAGDLFVVFGMAFIVYGLFLLARYKAQIANKTYIFTICYIGALILKVTLEFLLAPIFGLSGIMFGFLAGYIFLYLLLLIWYSIDGSLEWLRNRELQRIILLGLTLIILPLSLPNLIAALLSLPLLYVAVKLGFFASFAKVSDVYQNLQ